MQMIAIGQSIVNGLIFLIFSRKTRKQCNSYLYMYVSLINTNNTFAVNSTALNIILFLSSYGNILYFVSIIIFKELFIRSSLARMIILMEEFSLSYKKKFNDRTGSSSHVNARLQCQLVGKRKSLESFQICPSLANFISSARMITTSR